MATSLKIKIVDLEGKKPYLGDVKDGIVSIVEIPKDKDRSILSCKVRLQSFDSMEFSDASIYILFMLDDTIQKAIKYHTRQATITRLPNYHYLSSVIDNIDLRDYFGVFHEASV